MKIHKETVETPPMEHKQEEDAQVQKSLEEREQAEKEIRQQELESWARMELIQDYIFIAIKWGCFLLFSLLYFSLLW